MHISINRSLNEIWSIFILLIGTSQLDAGTYSEPVTYLHIYRKWKSLKSPKDRNVWASEAGIVPARMADFASTVDNLLKSVNTSLKRTGQKNTDLLKDSLSINCFVSPQKLNMYRLILTWASPGNIIKHRNLDRTLGTHLKLQGPSGWLMIWWRLCYQIIKSCL